VAKSIDVGVIYYVHPREGEALEKEGIVSHIMERGFSVKQVGTGQRRQGNLENFDYRVQVALSLFPREKYLFDCHLSWKRIPEIIINANFAEKLNFNPYLWYFPSPRLFPYFWSGWHLPVPCSFIILQFTPLRTALEATRLGRKRYLEALIDERVSFIDVLP
jgi:hypothetical protein